MRQAPRPADICASLLGALEAAEGRRRARKRDQTPDAIGLAVKRRLLQRVVQEAPEAAAFEAWLLGYAEREARAGDAGAVCAMARTVFEEWRLAHAMRDFAAWLEFGARSDDANVPSESPAVEPGGHAGVR